MKTRGELIVAGHRGARGLAEDNTLSGYRVAIKHGVDIIETDCRLTKDGVVVLRHDAHLMDLDGRKTKVAELTLKQLKKARRHAITLEQAISFTDRRARLMLEIKEPAAAEPTAHIIERYLAQGWQPEDFMVASFKYSVLRYLKRRLPNVDLVVLDGKSSLRAMWRAWRLGTNYLSIDQRNMWWGGVWLLSARYNLFCYAPSSGKDICKKPLAWHRFGLFGAITDRPDFYAKSAIVK